MLLERESAPEEEGVDVRAGRAAMEGGEMERERVGGGVR